MRTVVRMCSPPWSYVLTATHPREPEWLIMATPDGVVDFYRRGRLVRPGEVPSAVRDELTIALASRRSVA